MRDVEDERRVHIHLTTAGRRLKARAAKVPACLLAATQCSLPEIVQLAAAALQQMRTIAEGMTIDAQRMRDNLDITHGLIMAEAVTLALGKSMGRLDAHHAVEAACRQAASSASIRGCTRPARSRSWVKSSRARRFLCPRPIWWMRSGATALPRR